MKSGKKRKKEIFAKRRAKQHEVILNPYEDLESLPEGTIRADHKELSHINTYGSLPYFYIDKLYICVDCKSEEMWSARDQKWWYEVAKGHIDSRAIRCLSCRNKIKAEKDQQKAHMEAKTSEKPHPHRAFLQKLERNKQKY
ncbi:zinc-ribbon domain containing protein [Endozoicomonas arenosclerae]|uniref:zinc-ribbon domain containing protein n=1 Tax=Endozoicomonas arenosclerae TaxID=1633495 RepID=UPI00078166BE|nr:zinc-ribbon domain containing protein [Endozoicomonas arenosclerae]